MRTAPFTVIDALTIEDAIDVLDRLGSRAKLLAGGQDLIGELNSRRTAVDVLVSLKTIRALRGVHRDGGWIEIGAMTRMREIEDLVHNGHVDPPGIFGVLASVASAAGPKAVRTLGTPGGNIASTRAGTLWPAALSSLGARLRLVDTAGARDLSPTDGIRALREAKSPCLIASIAIKDEALRLVIGRARLPLTPYPLPAVCAVAIPRDGQQTARITIVGPGGVPCYREVAADALGDVEVCAELIAETLCAIENAEARRTSEIVLRALIRRVASRAKRDDRAQTYRTVLVDA